jgi:hypothetical protein
MKFVGKTVKLAANGDLGAVFVGERDPRKAEAV